MGRAGENKLIELQARAAAIAELARTLDEELRALVAGGGLGTPTPDRWQVIERGKETYLNEVDVEELWKSSQADLIVHGPKMMLRYRKRDQGGREWPLSQGTITPTQYKIFLAGLYDPGPGHVFGNKTLSAMGLRGISCRSLSTYIVGITKPIQGGDTKGPYIYRTFWASDVADKGWGYKFDPKWQYIVILEKSS